MTMALSTNGTCLQRHSYTYFDTELEELKGLPSAGQKYTLMHRFQYQISGDNALTLISLMLCRPQHPHRHNPITPTLKQLPQTMDFDVKFRKYSGGIVPRPPL